MISCTSDKIDESNTDIPFDPAYSAFSSILKKHVVGELVDYKNLQINRAPLDTFIIQLATLSSSELNSMDSTAIKAFWINAYNGITLRSVIDAYPVKSIKDIDGVWDEKKWLVAGQQVTLDDIEHNILRPVFKDPRIHFAVNCASIGCPPLYTSPFSGKILDAQLDLITAEFINNYTRNEIDFQSQYIKTTQIFSWFKDDFSMNTTETDHKKQIIKFIAKYIDSSQTETFNKIKDWNIEYLPYDWSLNDFQP